ncbi:hypothetical protein CDO52_12465 [Nocardiopsis gilva YIM 90087]|uniref:Uncharacterized protein n=1 Tax=Nocardiopsis gilva YIM 90087 TaxID=1235441 RepID=A0A223S5U3_9ACTN|nr:hypothetical protein [Nocardiopsis gilva]ASU83490.1 hypothetical protein CDO52_12465 [Nocardiopsis gilva YIM 90087]
MSRSDSAGRKGRRRSRRAAPDDHVQDGHDQGGAVDVADDASAADDYEYDPAAGAADDGDGDGENAQRGRAGAGRGRRSAAKKGAKAGRGRRSAGSPDPVSKFSASALKRVSVLGDRPNQVVYTLAEQSQRKRGSVVLGTLLALCGVALVSLLGVLIVQLVRGETIGGYGDGANAIVEPPKGHSTLVPRLYQGQTESTDVFAPIAERPKDAEPLKEKEVFADAEKLSLKDYELLLDDSEVTDTCTAVVWGEQLQQALVDGSCGSAARGVYQDQNKKFVAQFTLFDMSDAEAAGKVATALDINDPTNTEPGFLLPLDDDIKGLHEGYSQATAQVMGHYLAVFWVARADGSDPGDDDSMATLNVAAMEAGVYVLEEVKAAKEQEG